jgi:molybdate transport system permease protein
MTGLLADESVAGPLGLSLKIATIATIVAGVVGVAIAYVVSRRRFRGKAIVEALICLPLVLPPTVVGYLLIVAFGKQSFIGRLFNYSIVFRLEGAILAAAVVALPLIYIPSRAAFASVSREMEDVARLLGANWLERFWHVSLPLARRGITAGLILGFARALGEFGATMMVFGYTTGRVTLPISIYTDYEQGADFSHALPAVLTLIAISLVVMLLYNRSSLSRQD